MNENEVANLGVCCEGMKNLMANVGGQGVSVICFRDEEWREFRLQARSLTRSQATAWEQNLANPAESERLKHLFADKTNTLLPILSLITISLRFCPFCGSDLQRTIVDRRPIFDRLAAEHEPFRSK